MRWPPILCLMALTAPGCAELDATKVALPEAETQAQPESVEMTATPPPTKVEQAPTIAAPAGRPVASVGPEVIRLPELTAAVKASLAELPPDQPPNRRQTIVLARAVLKAMIVRTLVFQEAREVLGGQAQVDAMVKVFERRWVDRDLPELLRSEGVANEAGLRSKLAKRPATPEMLREEFLIRSMAEALMNRESSSGDLASYLEALRRRRPITSIMNEAELAAAGREAAP